MLTVMAEHPTLADCHLACGTAPPRSPPSERDLDIARRAVCVALGAPLAWASLRHPASPLRTGLLQALSRETQDPDTHPIRWLREGAPLGIERQLELGGHFPAKDDPTAASLDWPAWGAGGKG